jgi:hypothetical protein
MSNFREHANFGVCVRRVGERWPALTTFEAADCIPIRTGLSRPLSLRRLLNRLNRASG